MHTTFPVYRDSKANTCTFNLSVYAGEFTTYGGVCMCLLNRATMSIGVTTSSILNKINAKNIVYHTS